MKTVSVVIPFHRHENIDYLNLCLESLTNQNIDLEVIIVLTHLCSSIDESTNLKRFKSFRMIVEPLANTYAKKMNLGAKCSSSDFILIAQDDLVFSKDALKIMVDEFGTSENVIMNPVSNCDNNNHFFTNFVFKDKEKTYVVGSSATIEEVKEILPILMDKIAMAPVWQKVGYLNTFCTMFPKAIWEKIGGFDEKFLYGKEDIDLSLRANKLGIIMVINWNVFVLHFSGATAKHFNMKEIDLLDRKYLAEKYNGQTDFMFESNRPIS